MTPTIIESPYAGDRARNSKYLRCALYDSLMRDEAPFASHAIYPLVLNDIDEKEREQGIQAGYAWWPAAARIAFYIDLGWSSGMRRALELAVNANLPFETRSLGVDWDGKPAQHNPASDVSGDLAAGPGVAQGTKSPSELPRGREGLAVPDVSRPGGPAPSLPQDFPQR